MILKDRDIMVDLETLATTPDAVIITIGAVRFDPFGDDTWATDFLKTIKNKEDKEKFGQMIASFDALRTFIRENKIYQKLICSYPDPEMDSKIVERLISGRVTNNQAN